MRQRKELVKTLVREGVIRREEVKEAFLKVPREDFVPPDYKSLAYEDHPLPIPGGQTISAPHMCAILCEEAKVSRGDRVLEIGTGSGYQAAICAQIVSPENMVEGYVVSVEIIKELAYYARDNLRRSGYYAKVDLIVADGSVGAPVRLKFNKIIVTAAAPNIPEELIDQLEEGGILVIPVGPRWMQVLTRVEKRGGRIHKKYVTSCIFVELKGMRGYDSSRVH